MDWDEPFNDEDEGVLCNYCGMSGLTWGRNGLSPWMLMEDGKPHKCEIEDWSLDDEIPF